jgi:hypothetical protein
LALATSEQSHLRPCIASFNLSALKGSAQLLLSDARIQKVNLPPKNKRKGEIALLIPAPLAVSLLSKIHFRSIEDRQEFERAAKDVSNVDLSPYPVEVSESLFSNVTELQLPIPQQGQLLKRSGDNSPAFGQAMGGMLAMLYQMANRSELGLAIFHSATGAATLEELGQLKVDSILTQVPNWLNAAGVVEGDVPVQLFWGSVQAIIDAQTQGIHSTPVDIVLEHLERTLGGLQDIKLRNHLQTLIGDMRGCFGLSSGTTTELFERHKGALSRSFLMFCLRANCTELLEFSHPLLSDSEYILASILFGVRETWLKLPRELRPRETIDYITWAMVDAEHKQQGTEINLSLLPARPRPLRELLTSPGGEWSKVQTECALELVRHCQWNDCIQTRIQLLGDEKRPKSVFIEDSQILLPGDVITKSEIIADQFWRQMAQFPLISQEIESVLRKKLNEGKEIACE